MKGFGDRSQASTSGVRPAGIPRDLIAAVVLGLAFSTGCGTAPAPVTKAGQEVVAPGEKPAPIDETSRIGEQDQAMKSMQKRMDTQMMPKEKKK